MVTMSWKLSKTCATLKGRDLHIMTGRPRKKIDRFSMRYLNCPSSGCLPAAVCLFKIFVTVLMASDERSQRCADSGMVGRFLQ